MTENENLIQIQDLRTQFLSKLEGLDPDVVHPADLHRVKTDDSYLNRFILHQDNNIDGALNMLWETCEWRKSFGANDINENNVNKNILELGSVFPYGKDKDGKTLLVFKSKKHFKSAFDFADQKRCLVYWMERLERQEKGEKISLFFDMEGALLGNMDMEYTKYLISLFKNYYPNFLNYIIIFEMAWVLNAVFKVIKSLLPPKAVEKMKFVSKSHVKDFIDMECALKSWGGNDYYVFQFEPEQRATSPGFLTNKMKQEQDDNRKKVHFADSFKTEQLNESGFEEVHTMTAPFSASGTRLTTRDIMVFNTEGSEITSSLPLRNDDSQYISYKIKTTAPEKFRVRPSSGILAPGASCNIGIVLLPGYQVQNLQRDKFLILSIPIEQGEMSQAEINELWKQRGDKEVHQHKVQCSLQQNKDIASKNGTPLGSLSSEEQKVVTKLHSDITKLNTYASSLREELKLIRRQQWIILLSLIIVICSLFYAIFLGYSKSHNIKQNCWADSKFSDD
ncbi:hypothetical protein RUM44_010090 [Polyplax serrata]|uniref:Motile sperm domain-containing protein 2 n=1 Tax=Polyplax serrata TaxID=468196 RepID=A0ABR1AUK7_POLSC